MALTSDELIFLRGVYGLNPADSSKDNQILGGANGVGKVPTDPGFYHDLFDYAQKLGIDPVWPLIVMASESNFAVDRIAPPSIVQSGPLAGHDVTPRGLIGFTASNIPTTMSWAEWDALPTMTPRQQLAYVFRVLGTHMQRLGRPYKNAFEVYASVAAPAVLRPDGIYDPNAVLYSGTNWETNLNLDSWPNYFGRIAALRGETEEAKHPLAYAQKLVGLHLLRGKVVLGDLQNWLDRMNGQDPNGAGWAGNPARWALSWNLAAKRFNDNNIARLPKSFPNPPNVQPRSNPYAPASFTSNTYVVDRPGYHFDPSMGSNSPPPPPGASQPSASIAFNGGDVAQGAGSWWGLVIGTGILVGGALALAHVVKR